jgi:hypothetical protein
MLQWPTSGGVIIGDPYPIHEFIEQLSPVARNAVAGDLVSKIGTMIGDKVVAELGKEIAMAR